MLTKQAFIDRKPVVKKVEVPEWDDFVYIKKMSAGERVQLMRNTTKIEGKDVSLDQDNFMDSIVRTVQMVLCDENGVRLFNNSEEDFNILNDKDGVVLEKIFYEVMAFNGLGVESENEALKN
jgi:hypothetical protein